MLLLMKCSGEPTRIVDPLRSVHVYDLTVPDLADMLLMCAEVLPDPEAVLNDDSDFRQAARLLHDHLTRPGVQDRGMLSIFEAWKRHRALYGRSWADKRWYSRQRGACKRKLKLDLCLAQMFAKFKETRSGTKNH
ncbi:MAG: hypothetical protein U0R19_37540 [Bryobacteraceae bacterium]